MTCYSSGGLGYLPHGLGPVLWGTGSLQDTMCAGLVKEEKVDWEQHELDGHYPRMHGCDVCGRASMQSLQLQQRVAD